MIFLLPLLNPCNRHLTQLKQDQVQLAHDLEELKMEIERFMRLGDLKQARGRECGNASGGCLVLGKDTTFVSTSGASKHLLACLLLIAFDSSLCQR